MIWVSVLGICYGSQLMMHQLGGKVCKAPVREYGKIEVTVDQSSALFENVSEKTICWMSHNDYIEQAAPGFKIIAHTPDCPVAAVENVEKETVCNSVPSGSSSYKRRKTDAGKFRI